MAPVLQHIGGLPSDYMNKLLDDKTPLFLCLFELLTEEGWQCLEADNELKEVVERGNEEAN